MTRQFTFKTTIETDWLDPILEGMSSYERSAFIRRAIIAQVTQTSHKGDTNVTHQSTNVITKSGIEHMLKHMPSLDEPEIVALGVTEDDLEARLNSLNFE